MKKIISFMTLMTFLSSASFAFALTPPASESGTRLQEKMVTRDANLKTRADNEITRRITSLNELITRIGDIKRLTTAQKTTFTNEVQTEITSLTTLKTKIDADTDTTTLKTDVQSIVQSYRVYAVYMPQIRILAAIDGMSNATDKLTTIWTTLQTEINDAKTAGKDVTSLTTTLTDMQTKITDAKTQFTNAQNAVISLTPAGYPGNKTALLNAHTSLKTAEQDLKAALQDARTIRQGLKALGVKPTENTSSTSAK